MAVALFVKVVLFCIFGIECVHLMDWLPHLASKSRKSSLCATYKFSARRPTSQSPKRTCGVHVTEAGSHC